MFSQRACAVACLVLGLLSAVLLLPARPASAGILDASWFAPTTNTDGSPLTDLASYSVYYGTSDSPLLGEMSGFTDQELSQFECGGQVRKSNKIATVFDLGSRLTLTSSLDTSEGKIVRFTDVTLTDTTNGISKSFGGTF